MSKHDESHELEPTPEELAAKDEQIHVPKGQSRLRFILVLGLMIFTLIIFVIPDQFQRAFQRGDPAKEAVFSWVHPTEGKLELTRLEFELEARRFGNFMRLVGTRDERKLLEFEQVGRMLVLDRLASDAGIEIPDVELQNVLRDGALITLSRPALPTVDTEAREFMVYLPPVGDAATFKQNLSRAGVSAREFESGLRRMLRIQRFEALLALSAEPDGAAIEKAWKTAHKEHQFHFVAIDPEAMRAEVEAAPATDEQLRAWFDGLDAARKQRTFSAEWKPERVSAEILAWKFDESPALNELLARYPRPEGADLEALAQNYYNQFSNVRFRRPEEDPNAATAAERLYLPFDAVADVARRESKIHAALVDMSIEMQGKMRVGQAPAELMTLAAELGLTCVREESPKSQIEWNEFFGPDDAMLAGSIMRAARSDNFVPLNVSAKQISFGRTLSRVDAAAPGFEEVQAKAMTEWKTERLRELAQGKAQAFVDQLRAAATLAGVAPTAELTADTTTFAAKAEAVGLTVLASDWLDGSKLERSDAETPTEQERFVGELAMIEMMANAMRSNNMVGSSLIEAKPDVVVGPRAAMTGDRTYIVRKAGERDPETVNLEPADYSTLVRMASDERAASARDELIGLKALEARFGLAFPGLRRSESEGIPPPPPPQPSKS